MNEQSSRLAACLAAISIRRRTSIEAGRPLPYDTLPYDDKVLDLLGISGYIT